MSAIINAVPKVILNGIDDQSAVPLPRDPEQIPMHLPLFFGFAERGPSESLLLRNMSEINSIYGTRTMSYTDKYATHVSPFITTVLARANSIMFKRIIPDDAATGDLVLKLHMSKEKLPVYEREEDGTYKTDSNGNYIPVANKTVDGYKLKWEISPSDALAMHGLKRTIGDKADEDGDNGDEEPPANPEVKVYTIMEFKASSPGEFSGNVGFKLFVPTASHTSPPDMNLMEDKKCMLLRFSMLERPDALSAPNVIVNQMGETSVDFTFKKGIVDRYGIEKHYEQALIPSYQDTATPGFTPIYSPIGDIRLHRDNYETVSKLIKEAEIKSVEVTGETGVGANDMDVYEVNFFSGITRNDIPFSAIEYDTVPSENIVTTTMSEFSIKYLNSGDDGVINEDILDGAVKNLMLNGWENPSDPISDMATKPFSAIWDSGYSIDTKRSLCETLGHRKDVYVNLSTFEHDSEPLDWAQEESVANILKTYASGYPESEIYGTSTCRALVISERAKMSDNVWKNPIPVSIDLADKFSLFMGAGNGFMNEGFGYDVSPNNQITLIKEITGLYKTDRQRQRDWDAGMVYAQSYDRRSSFFPAVQTVYPNDTSILNSSINMCIATELQKVCASVWRDLSGNAKLEPDQFIERSNAMITERTINRFDDRVTIVPDTFYSAADLARGFSWSCKVYMYASNMKTVGAFTVVSRRQEDLAA